MLYQFLTKLDWFSTLFPRIPVPIQKQIESKLANYCREYNVNFAGSAAPDAAPQTGRNRNFDRYNQRQDESDRRPRSRSPRTSRDVVIAAPRDDRVMERDRGERSDRWERGDRGERNNDRDRSDRGSGDRGSGDRGSSGRERDDRYGYDRHERSERRREQGSREKERDRFREKDYREARHGHRDQNGRNSREQDRKYR